MRRQIRRMIFGSALAATFGMAGAIAAPAVHAQQMDEPIRQDFQDDDDGMDWGWLGLLGLAGLLGLRRRDHEHHPHVDTTTTRRPPVT